MEQVISTRYIIQRRWTRGASYASRQWHDFDWAPDGRVNIFVPAVFKTLEETKKALKKIRKNYPDAEFRVALSQRTLIEL